MEETKAALTEAEVVNAEQDPFIKQIEEERARAIYAAQMTQVVRHSKHEGSRCPKEMVKARNRYKNKLARKARKMNRKARNR